MNGATHCRLFFWRDIVGRALCEWLFIPSTKARNRLVMVNLDTDRIKLTVLNTREGVDSEGEGAEAEGGKRARVREGGESEGRR